MSTVIIRLCEASNFGARCSRCTNPLTLIKGKPNLFIAETNLPICGTCAQEAPALAMLLDQPTAQDLEQFSESLETLKLVLRWNVESKDYARAIEEMRNALESAHIGASAGRRTDVDVEVDPETLPS